MGRRYYHRLMILVILIVLIIIFYGKLFLIEPSNLFLYFYGLAIIGVNFVMFFVAQRYVDPSVDIVNNDLNKGKEKPFISVVLAVHNEEDIIERCVQSFLDSDYVNKEIVIVNDASTDNTLRVLQDSFGDNPIVKIIDLERNVGKKRAIGMGLRVAKGEIYVMTDSDSIVEPHAITRIVEVFVYDADVGAISGHGRALNSNRSIFTKIQDTWYDGQFAVKKAFESVFGAVTCISGPLAAFRKDAIFNFIPAWENDRFLGSEWKFSTDRTLTGFVLGSKFVGAKLKEKYKDSWFVKSKDYELKDWKLIYLKSAKVWTEVPDTFTKLIKQQVRWKKSFIRNIFFTGRFYWRKPLIPAFRYYMSILFVIVGPFVVLRHLFFLPFVKGEYFSFVFYLFGVLFIGSLYSIVFKLENPHSHRWVYRPFMSIFSTVVFSWLIFYSLVTIRRSIWHRK